ncbi:metallophosphoesterase family protein [Stenotrophomonas sp. SY1]|uniref:purple acid phosphatase family protein n=1 Tax=Stenotrophomonas sp. SY1 TaxID=477235 RepID=UPI001E4B5B7C|nr:metallophosphoesterase family protein [Stenotrophomonas sp. SY1]MCD9086824.1 metallophosphoesterase family protein [Stenotrophomonas sp. SY1]
MMVAAGAVGAAPVAEPNTQVPAGSRHYAASSFPDRIVASPAQDAGSGFAVAWRTAPLPFVPRLELAIAGDSPDMGQVQQLTARSRALQSENGSSQHHRVDLTGLLPDTLYAYRVQGQDTWSAWHHFRTAASADQPLTLLYFGDTQNKNLSHVSRVIRQGWQTAPDARLALFAGDLVSGGDGQDDSEWGEWFAAAGALLPGMAVAPAAGNHEYFEEFEDTPQERRVLGGHWPVSFALPGNGAANATSTTYWFDYQAVRVVVLDGTSALDLGTARTQAKWLDGVLAASRQPWNIVVVHQPLYPLRAERDNTVLAEQVQPVLRRHHVDLVLQGHDHTYGRRGDDRGALPQYISSVAGPKQYRLSAQARATMQPVAEDTQLFQVLRIHQGRLHYEARTATGRLYDAFQISRDDAGKKQFSELREGRIGQRDCPRAASPKGRDDRCWE